MGLDQSPRRARTRRETALLKSGALQNAILSSANFSSIATDDSGVIQIFDVGAQRMLGCAAADVLNRITPADISDPQELLQRAGALSAGFGTPIAPGFEALVFKASRGIEDIDELTYVRKDSSRLPAVVSVTALRNAQEAIIGYLLIGTDNTARKRVDAEQLRLDQALLETHRELQIAKVAAETANLAKSDFLSSMSHELRSPLNAILGFAQLIDSGMPAPTPGQKDRVDPIMQAGWYLLEPLSNAIKYSRRGGWVVVSCRGVAADRVRVSVRDTGLGLPPEKLAQLFQPFNRMGQEGGEQEGTGIGLVVSKLLVERLGGTIGVGSPVGVGSEVWVELAASAAIESAVHADLPVLPAPAELAAGVRRRTLLCVEDNPANLLRVARVLSRRPDIRLISAKDCRSGVELARSAQPDVILMDINLPGISGVTALCILLADAATAHIPVVALSADAMPRDIEKGLAAGFFCYLTRPIKLDEFLHTPDLALEHATTHPARDRAETESLPC